MTVTCASCGHQLKDVDETPCPKCGDSRRNVHLEARTGTYAIAGASLSMTVERIKQEVKKNWPVIFILVASDALSCFPAYFFSKWTSVVVTIFFIITSTVLGYFALTRVITITRETK